MMWRGVIHQYRKFLPVTDRTPVITLYEGNTPPIRAERLADTLGIRVELYLKVEGANPTGSFKDRGMTVAISQAGEAGGDGGGCAPPRKTPRRTAAARAP